MPPYAFPAVATVAPQAITREPSEPAVAPEPAAPCDLSTTCPSCSTQMQPEHAHYRCPACGYRDSCCF